jgi:hypothetical protein
MSLLRANAIIYNSLQALIHEEMQSLSLFYSTLNSIF